VAINLIIIVLNILIRNIDLWHRLSILTLSQLCSHHFLNKVFFLNISFFYLKFLVAIITIYNWFLMFIAHLLITKDITEHYIFLLKLIIKVIIIIIWFRLFSLFNRLVVTFCKTDIVIILILLKHLITWPDLSLWLKSRQMFLIFCLTNYLFFAPIKTRGSVQYFNISIYPIALISFEHFLLYWLLQAYFNILFEDIIVFWTIAWGE